MRISRQLPAIMAAICLTSGVLAVPSTAVAQDSSLPVEELTANHPWIGKVAPHIDLVSIAGEQVSLMDYRGKKFLVVHFAASW